MTWLDLFILGIFVVSALVGAWRGLVRESLSLTTWVLAIWISIRFSSAFAGLLPDSLTRLSFSVGELQFRVDNLRVGIAMLILFILTLVVGGVVSILLGYLVKVANFTLTDRILGGAFGLLRGAVLVVGLALLAGLTTVPTYDFWDGSLLIDPFEGLAKWILGVLPAHVASHFSYS